MLSLSPSASLRAENAPQIVTRASLAPIVSDNMPRNLSAIPPAIRSLPLPLQVVALCDMLADARAELAKRTEQRDICAGRFAQAAGVAFMFGAPIDSIISR